MRLVRTFSMIIALAGASTVFADAPAPKGEELSQAEAEKIFTFITTLADAIIVNKDSCPKMGVAINGVIDSHKELLDKAAAMRASGKKPPKALQDKMNAKMGEAGPALMKCVEDKGVKAALARMDEKTRGKAPPGAKKDEPKVEPKK